MYFKNVGGQGVYLYAHDTVNNIAKVGDSNNITGLISKDGAGAASLTTVHPTEIGGGIYWHPLSQSETDANAWANYWTSSTTGVQIDPVIVSTQAGTIPPFGYGTPQGITTDAALSAAHGSGAWNNAGGGSDPLFNTVPGAYPPDSAGYALGKILSGPVIFSTASGPASDLAITIFKGDDYYTADGFPLTWSLPKLPSLVGATVAFYLDGLLVGNLTITGAGTANQVGKFDLASAVSISLNTGPHTYSLRATLADGHKVTLTPAAHPRLEVVAAP